MLSRRPEPRVRALRGRLIECTFVAQRWPTACKNQHVRTQKWWQVNPSWLAACKALARARVLTTTPTTSSSPTTTDRRHPRTPSTRNGRGRGINKVKSGRRERVLRHVPDREIDADALGLAEVHVEQRRLRVVGRAGSLRDLKRDRVQEDGVAEDGQAACLLYTSPSPRDATLSRMPSSA